MEYESRVTSLTDTSSSPFDAVSCSASVEVSTDVYLSADGTRSVEIALILAKISITPADSVSRKYTAIELSFSTRLILSVLL